MTLKDWHADEQNRAALAQLLANPTFNAALSLVEATNVPVFRPGASPEDLALVHAFQAGVHHVRRSLVFLTKELKDAEPDPAPWAHVKPTE